MLFASEGSVIENLHFASGIYSCYIPRVATKKKAVWEGCPIRFGMGVFGDKWTLLIIRDLMFKGKRFYGEFTEPVEGIATNILSDRLNRLQEHEIILKERDQHHGARFVYRLTDKGKDLLPVMLSIVEWSEKHDPNTEAPPEFMQKLRNDPDELRTEILRALDTDKV